MKRLQKLAKTQKLAYEKFYVHVKILRTRNCRRKFFINLPKSTKKTCKPNRCDLNRDWITLYGQSFYIHHQIIKIFLIEICKALYDNSGNSFKELFVRRESTVNLQSKPDLLITSVNFTLKGKNSFRYFGPVILNSVPIEIREDIGF